MRRGLVPSLLVSLTLAAVAGQTGPTYHFYQLQTPRFMQANADKLASSLNLSRNQDTKFNGSIYMMGDGSVRGGFVGGNNFLLDILPDLRSENVLLPAVQVQLRQSLDFANANGFFPPDGFNSWKSQINTWSNQMGSPTGGGGQRMDLIRSVRYYRLVDGIPVYGPSSNAVVFCDANGVVGCMNNLRPISRFTQFEPTIKSQSQVSRELDMDIKNFHFSGTPKVLSQMPIYLEQGLSFLQPVMLCDVQFTDPNGQTSCNYILIALSKNCPEFIRDCQDGANPTMVDPVRAPGQTPAESAEFVNENMMASIAPVAPRAAAAQANPVYVGQYIVRQDHPCWLGDAQSFWSNMMFGRALTFWHPTIARRDYWWDEPWCWEPALGYPDNSPYFVGQDHFALIEGHGAPWLCTCLQNCCEVVHLNTSNGYGVYANGTERTAYIMWQSCDVIPEPGHAFDGDFTSGSAWDVWWRVFKGMRANFGYRTLMHICNGVGGIFGFKAAIGQQNTSAWLASTDEGVFGHLDGLDYGSTVLVSGHEGDTFYDTAQLPPPGSLTMWWIHA